MKQWLYKNKSGKVMSFFRFLFLFSAKSQIGSLSSIIIISSLLMQRARDLRPIFIIIAPEISFRVPKTIVKYRDHCS